MARLMAAAPNQGPQPESDFLQAGNRREPEFGALVSCPQDLLPRPFTHRVIGQRLPFSKFNRDRNTPHYECCTH
jgi:hypothetical protein